MKKKLLCLLLSLGMVAALAACSNNEAPDGGESQTPDNTNTESVQPTESGAVDSGYVFQTADGKTVAINEDMQQVLADLGEAQSYFEAESCAFEGLDKTYTYAGFTITTRPEGEKDYVNSILLTDDSVTTPEGAYIGSSKEDVEALYGTESGDMEAMLTYVKDGVSLNFVLIDGAVASIEYLAE